MQNLVLKNPIQRFKQGKKIVKALGGTSEGGLKYNYNMIGIEPPSLSLPSKDWRNAKLLDVGNIGVPSSIREPLVNGVPLSEKRREYTTNEIPEIVATSSKKTTRPQKTNNNSFYQFGKMGGWKRSMGKGAIKDQESLNMLKEMGMEGKSAQEVQNKINEVFGSNAVKSDNLWGNQSRKGLAALYERWKSEQKLSSPPIITPRNEDPNINKRLELQALRETPELQTEYNIVNNNLQVSPNQQVFARNGNYNRSQIRDYMRQMGLNPYNFTGAERKALRLWLNGQSNDNSLLTGRLRDLFVTPYGYKQGGQLVSRNPIVRFKNKKK